MSDKPRILTAVENFLAGLPQEFHPTASVIVHLPVEAFHELRAAAAELAGDFSKWRAEVSAPPAPPVSEQPPVPPAPPADPAVPLENTEPAPPTDQPAS